MIRSMTGYGRSGSGEADAQFSVEVRSLNNRYLDVQVKTPRGLAFMEQRVKKKVQERFSRGRFDVFINRNGSLERSGTLVVDESLAEQYIAILRGLKGRFGLTGDVDIAVVAALPELITATEAKEDPEAQWQALSKDLDHALEGLDRMRTEEGRALVQDIRERLETIERLIRKIRGNSTSTVENARKRMNETLSRLLNEQPDPVRLAQEIAILAERTDITEELTRLNSHMAQYRILLGDPGNEAVGRKLDFMIQEMGREVNTIASKAMDAQISMDVVHIKAELEKIREQVQNIE